MNLLNLKYFFLAVVLCFCSIGFAQTKEEQVQKTSLGVAIEPLFLARSITKLDIEYKPKKHLFSYIVSPEIASGTVYDQALFSWDRNPSEDHLKGFGIGLFQKISAKVKSKAIPYLAYGLTYRKNTISYDDEGFVPYTKENLSFYEYRRYNDDLKIETYLISLLSGVQITGSSKIQCDVYGGFGYKSSKKSSMIIEGKRNYNHSFSDYAYNGFIFQLGVRFGYKIL